MILEYSQSMLEFPTLLKDALDSHTFPTVHMVGKSVNIRAILSTPQKFNIGWSSLISYMMVQYYFLFKCIGCLCMLLNIFFTAVHW